MEAGLLLCNLGIKKRLFEIKDFNNFRKFKIYMLSDILKPIGKFSIEELELIEMHLIKSKYRKNDILLKEGTICTKAWFIISGSIYQFKYDDIEENVLDLHCENDWLVDHTSFVTQKPSVTIIKAYTDCEVLEINIDSVHQLITQSHSFLQLGKILNTAVSRLNYFDNSLTPREKYDFIMKSRPQLLQKFPLKIIASYLKITRETLSRVRSLA